ncbi:MAG: hypothetical protein H6623_04350 [Bdellovibrionaceae bacterium]|nr:hypothetical protein [Pseudobdellovibrionaceae bacterium]
MRKILFIIFTTSFLTTIGFQNCSNKKFSTALDAPVTPYGTDDGGGGGGYVGGNSNIRIIINKYPSSMSQVGDPQVIDYTVTATNSTIKTVQCTLDNTPIACDATDNIDLSNVGEGSHSFEIYGENTDGKSGSEIVHWTVYKKIIVKTKDIIVSSSKTADIIINVDNSYSMANIQTSMASRISNLLSKIQSLDSYRIAVITTEPSSPIANHINHIDGKFNQFANGSYCLTESTATSALIGGVVQRPESLSSATAGNGYERGILTTYRSIERYNAGGGPESACLRQNVPKHVIIISDENESKYYEDDNGDPIVTQPMPDQMRSSGDNLISLITSSFGSASFKFHSIIINPYTTEGQQCYAQQKQLSIYKKYGTDYAQLSQKTGGVIGSVCASDYSTQLGVIGDSIIKAQRTYGLDCVAQKLDGSWGTVKRLSNNQYVSTYNLNGSNIDFTTDMPNDTYRITYFCYQ